MRVRAGLLGLGPGRGIPGERAATRRDRRLRCDRGLESGRDGCNHVHGEADASSTGENGHTSCRLGRRLQTTITVLRGDGGGNGRRQSDAPAQRPAARLGAVEKSAGSRLRSPAHAKRSGAGGDACTAARRVASGAAPQGADSLDEERMSAMKNAAQTPAEAAREASRALTNTAGVGKATLPTVPQWTGERAHS